MKIAVIKVGLGSCGIAAGARHVYDTLLQTKKDLSLDLEITPTGCIGACHREPILEVITEKGEHLLYGEVSEHKAKQFLEKNFDEGVFGKGSLIPEDYYYLSKQKKLVLKNSGVINPESITDYMKSGGYSALKRVLEE